MRQPTVGRRRTRQQRLLRTGIGVVVLVAVAAVIASLVGGGEPGEAPPETPRVAFRTSASAYAQKGSIREAREVGRGALRGARREIGALLNSWYQRTFVDPDVFEVSTETDEGPSFPPAELLELFSQQARTSATGDPEAMDALTLGVERTSFARVEPGRTRAALTFLFEGRRDPVMAVADVTFEATGILKDSTAFPVAIEQQAEFHLRRTGGGWVIVFFEAEQEQNSILPSPTATPTEEAS